MHEHKHSGCCEHDCVHYCKECNKAYCCKCGKEWGDVYYYHYNPYYPYWGTTTTLDKGVCYDTTTTSGVCSHSHL